MKFDYDVPHQEQEMESEEQESVAIEELDIGDSYYIIKE